VRLLEESWSQREARARQENEELMERLAAAAQQAERDRAELQAQHQRRLAQAQQERDREVQRLRDLQRYGTGNSGEMYQDGGWECAGKLCVERTLRRLSVVP